MNKTLSARLKRKYLPIIIKRDYGTKCFYCGTDLNYKEYVFEHLDDNRMYNEIWNIVLACYSCNERKKRDSGMHLKACKKKYDNQTDLTRVCEGEEEREETSAPPLNLILSTSDQIYEITEQYMYERIVTDGFLKYKGLSNSITMLCRRKIGRGSQSAVGRAIDALCSDEGPFKIVTNQDKTRIIVMRDIKLLN